jgi:hypothetical protein
MIMIAGLSYTLENYVPQAKLSYPPLWQSAYSQEDEDDEEGSEEEETGGGGLTATINAESFTKGDTITVRGAVSDREGGSIVFIKIVDPDGLDLGTDRANVHNDLSFTYGFIAGGIRGMDKPGTYNLELTYFPPGVGTGIESTNVSFEYTAGSSSAATASPSAGSSAVQEAVGEEEKSSTTEEEELAEEE